MWLTLNRIFFPSERMARSRQAQAGRATPRYHQGLKDFFFPLCFLSA